ncbi:hypothetical protein SISSUDRAFT_1131372 [Sistotremastrum suecicum HHB10207 ss-3]|uniref:Dynamin N-terminal domain-containing protein n=1 Tax=Sistotremastrum suecicum HHB10207 ss-3 TaxID=1314776 RepID=A0A166A900_9AGAM|nr:hypothetical protein SISSUDRAFT_1131372 [Sistotremastrum suecicum HHB10207 ss-3]
MNFTQQNDSGPTPAEDMKIGRNAVALISEDIEKISLGTQLRQTTWKNELQSFKDQRLPEVTIAVFGVTGAGKSSLLNAILQDNIVPTGGMGAACTSVAIEISYHPKTAIEARIHFLTREDWRKELENLLEDIGDPARHGGQPGDKESYEVALQKVRDVYPSISLNQLHNRTADDIINSHPESSRLLGTSKDISELESDAFIHELQRYISSNNHEIDPDDESSVELKPSLCPLIRRVAVRCNASVLSTGCTLVDLPGVADSNSARAAIATDYLRTCNFVWIVAPIIRASNDKIAKELLGDALKTQFQNNRIKSLTFIATKTDDVLVNEIAKDLNIKTNPLFQSIAAQEKLILQETSEWKKHLAAAKKEIKGLQEQLEQQRVMKTLQSDDDQSKGTSKRKRKASQKDSSKRQKRENDFSRVNSQDIVQETSDSSDSSDIDDAEADPRKQTIESDSESNRSRLEIKIRELESAIHIAEGRRSEAENQLWRRREQCTNTERQKKALCANQRNKVCARRVKEFLKTQLIQYNINNLNDSDNLPLLQSVPDSSSIDLPFFGCSSRDYMRLAKQTEDDQDPSCFSNEEETGIPGLQRWCRELVTTTQTSVARSFRERVHAFIRSTASYLTAAEAVSLEDRNKLRDLWQSAKVEPIEKKLSTDSNESSESLPKPPDSVEGTPYGIKSTLEQALQNVIATFTETIKARIRQELGPKCAIGAKKAQNTAVKTANNLCQEVRWNTYQAVLRRNGFYLRKGLTLNLNERLAKPLTESIAPTWAQFFESDIYQGFPEAALVPIQHLLGKVEESAPAGLKDRAKNQSLLALTEARLIIGSAMWMAKWWIDTEQKGASRLIPEQVKAGMLNAYNAAREQSGNGSKDRRKKIISDHLAKTSQKIFQEAEAAVFARLNDALDDIAQRMLSRIVREIPGKAEVTMSVLWENPQDSPEELKARKELLEKLKDLQTKFDLHVAMDSTSA